VPDSLAGLQSYLQSEFAQMKSLQSEHNGALKTEVCLLKDSVTRLTSLIETHPDGPAIHRIQRLEEGDRYIREDLSAIRRDLEAHVNAENSAELELARSAIAEKKLESKEHRRTFWAMVAAAVMGTGTVIGYLANWLLEKMPHGVGAK
jgi:hypothetical protein